MKTIIALILTCFTIFQADAAKVKLEEAIKRKQIQVIASGNGGYQGRKLRLDVKNLTSTPLEVEISAGTIFQSADEAEQNLMITKEEVFVMGPKGKKCDKFIYHVYPIAQFIASTKSTIHLQSHCPRRFIKTCQIDQ